MANADGLLEKTRGVLYELFFVFTCCIDRWSSFLLLCLCRHGEVCGDECRSESGHCKLGNMVSVDVSRDLASRCEAWTYYV